MIPREVSHFGAIRVDTSRWPLVFWDWPGERVADEVVGRCFDHMSQLWSNTPAGTRSFTVADLSLVKLAAPPTQRRLGAEFAGRNAHLIAKATLGGALVITSSIVRGTVTAVNWLRPPPSPVRVFATRTEAVLFGLDVIERDLGSLPPDLRLLRSKHEPSAREARKAHP
jgi:hypothetical protein